MPRIKAEEQRNVLEKVSKPANYIDLNTHAHGIGLGTIHITQEEIPELNGV